MKIYPSTDYMKLARRCRNSRRSYLFVNPLQAKHIPAAPSEALAMMYSLGNEIKNHYSTVDLVIGFAETATAIGLSVSHALHAPYIHTTRESLENEKEWIIFREEHSHAQEQKLYGEFLKERCANARTIVLVDDELSTGKTVRNMIYQLRREYRELSETKFIAASILYRLNEDSEKEMERMGIESIYLSRLPELDYETAVSQWETNEPDPICMADPSENEPCFSGIPGDNPRLGIVPEHYLAAWDAYTQRICGNLGQPSGRNILVLGTEECMMPALILGKRLESMGNRVRCHATTRSPIGISTKEAYPIFRGRQLHSFYDEKRVTYIYDLAKYDLALVVSDAGSWKEKAARSLRGALREQGCEKLIWIGGNRDVQHLSP